MEIFLAIAGSGALLGFVQFILTRIFVKQDRNDEVIKKIGEVKTKLDELSDRVDENAAVLARTHILRFSDELQNGIKHSSDYFRQQMDDIGTYERYCSTHPDFANGYTQAAARYISNTYDKLLEKGEFAIKELDNEVE